MQAQVGLEVAGAAEALMARLIETGTGISSAYPAGSGSLLPLSLPHPHLPVMQARKLFPHPQDSSLGLPVPGTLEPGRPGLVSCFFYSLCDLV